MFARSWIPFCKKHGIETRCPASYFDEFNEAKLRGNGITYLKEHQDMKAKYENFRKCVEKYSSSDKVNDSSFGTKQSHPSLVKIILDNGAKSDEQNIAMPRLVYVARERKPGVPHHFKAGALNVLLRVSAVISNSPYFLVLDCDMKINNCMSARQAMCFLLDPQLSSSLAFVQFPQFFSGVSKNDLYGGDIGLFFEMYWPGMDGYEGPILSGTGFYLKREAIYGQKPEYLLKQETKHDLHKDICKFGASNELIASVYQHTLNTNPQEWTHLASCAYEEGTAWGSEIGFRYLSVVEDYFTGLNLHCNGWKSIYYSPSRPAFLGSVPNCLHDNLLQAKRSGAGLLEVCFSTFFPLTYGIGKISVVGSACYTSLAFNPLYSMGVFFYSCIPQICMLHGLSLYPKIRTYRSGDVLEFWNTIFVVITFLTHCLIILEPTNPWFVVYAFIFTASSARNLQEMIRYGCSVRCWWNCQRMWLMRRVSSNLLAFIQVLLKLTGLGNVVFEVTSKAEDYDKDQKYEEEIMFFGEESPMYVPIVTIAVINLVCLAGGIGRIMWTGDLEEFFVQAFFSILLVIISFPVYEAMFIRKDNGRIPNSITTTSFVAAIIALSAGSILFRY